mmetsp:Transcript_10553/g.23246  ORF Transcript_10553/g.23246 Transcript_10553/m.23246 type:complete len:115 (-) Transcript_10553:184-528(-)|eukprot:CAMPEP_0206464720 /NCGR_PEP_ID=MMETSP0324_2-20121206/27385_1 /ASSEMBLY_ACC=CAM_ASM_000836 /TAXON_ID=2866 /ORGANISM="Crypthecodinium cohnii, Strain Seligo" /LENGTH=114 /DNA_ID=CAMNT_0053937407 /DNA_START=111 /DNA_END=455 /DNA_ORIENTATION=-
MRAFRRDMECQMQVLAAVAIEESRGALNHVQQNQDNIGLEVMRAWHKIHFLADCPRTWTARVDIPQECRGASAVDYLRWALEQLVELDTEQDPILVGADIAFAMVHWFKAMTLL